MKYQQVYMTSLIGVTEIKKKEGELPSFHLQTLTFDFKTFDFKTYLVTPGGLEPPPWEPESHVLSS